MFSPPPFYSCLRVKYLMTTSPLLSSSVISFISVVNQWSGQEGYLSGVCCTKSISVVFLLQWPLLFGLLLLYLKSTLADWWTWHRCTTQTSLRVSLLNRALTWRIPGHTLIKNKTKFSSNIKTFRQERLQSHIWLTASSNMTKYLCIFSNIRKPFLIYAPIWISLYMR